MSPRVTGLAPAACGRHGVGDVLSAPLMINNDRILTNLATTSLMTPLPTSISG